MSERIPAGINRQPVLAAIKVFDAGASHAFGSSVSPSRCWLIS
jgi:hypothetical protein